MLNNAVQQNYNVSISKKGEDYQYYWSIGYMDNEGIKDGDAFSRFTTRLNLESNVSKYITVGLNMNFSSRDESAIAVDTKALTWFLRIVVMMLTIQKVLTSTILMVQTPSPTHSMTVNIQIRNKYT